MDLTDVQTLITGTVTDAGVVALAIFGAVVAFGIAVYFVHWGYRKVTKSANGRV